MAASGTPYPPGKVEPSTAGIAATSDQPITARSPSRSASRHGRTPPKLLLDAGQLEVEAGFKLRGRPQVGERLVNELVGLRSYVVGAEGFDN